MYPFIAAMQMGLTFCQAWQMFGEWMATPPPLRDAIQITPRHYRLRNRYGEVLETRLEPEVAAKLSLVLIKTAE